MESKEIYSETVRHFLEPVLPLLDDLSVTEDMFARVINLPSSPRLGRAGKAGA